MFPDSFDKIACYANIKIPRSIAEDIDIIDLVHKTLERDPSMRQAKPNLVGMTQPSPVIPTEEPSDEWRDLSQQPLI